MMVARSYEPAPPGFRERFILDGWRGIERYYGARTDVMNRWIEECGGIDVLKAERRAHRAERFEAARLALLPAQGRAA